MPLRGGAACHAAAPVRAGCSQAGCSASTEATVQSTSGYGILVTIGRAVPMESARRSRPRWRRARRGARRHASASAEMAAACYAHKIACPKAVPSVGDFAVRAERRVGAACLMRGRASRACIGLRTGLRRLGRAGVLAAFAQPVSPHAISRTYSRRVRLGPCEGATPAEYGGSARRALCWRLVLPLVVWTRHRSYVRAVRYQLEPSAKQCRSKPTRPLRSSRRWPL